MLLYREALIWRMAELSEGACHHFQADGIISAIVLTRASVETAAALWYLHRKVEDVVSSGSLGDIDTYLMKLTCGTKTLGVEAQTKHRPVAVGKFLEAVERDIRGFSRQYGVLSDYAHPNWAGTTLMYTETDRRTAIATLGKNVSREYGKMTGIRTLSVALAMFEHSYNGLSDLSAEFVQLCEEKIVSGKAGKSSRSSRLCRVLRH